MEPWTIILILLILLVVIAAGICAFVLYRNNQKLTIELMDSNAKTKTLEKELEVRQEVTEEAKTQFKALSAESLENSNRQFLQLAETKFKQLHQRSDSELEQRQQAVENLVKPIQEALNKTNEQSRDIEKQRASAYGAIKEQMVGMHRDQESLRSETSKLVQALRQPQIRGRYGEITLRRLVELAGMSQHCDFDEQTSKRDDEGHQHRPDMIVHMPSERDIVIDAKTPLEHYLSAVDESDTEQKEQYLKKHAEVVKNHVNQLSSKQYWGQFENAPDFVILFIPGDQFLSAALEQNRELLENAFQKKIILATPTSLIALLRTVAYGWRQEKLTENAEIIRKHGVELHDRIAIFLEHLNSIGTNLNKSVEAYNKAVASFESRLTAGIRDFKTLGITSTKELPETNPVTQSARESKSK